MKTWKNQRGETVVDDGKTLRIVTALNVNASVDGHAANTQAGSLTEQVMREAALPENKNVRYAVDEALGLVGAITPPVNPYAVNADLGTLRSAVDKAETDVRHAIVSRASGNEIQRLNRKLEDARRELRAAEHALEIERLRQQGKL